MCVCFNACKIYSCSPTVPDIRARQSEDGNSKQKGKRCKHAPAQTSVCLFVSVLISFVCLSPSVCLSYTSHTHRAVYANIELTTSSTSTREASSLLLSLELERCLLGTRFGSRSGSSGSSSFGTMFSTSSSTTSCGLCVCVGREGGSSRVSSNVRERERGTETNK